MWLWRFYSSRFWPTVLLTQITTWKCLFFTHGHASPTHGISQSGAPKTLLNYPELMVENLVLSFVKQNILSVFYSVIALALVFPLPSPGEEFGGCPNWSQIWTHWPKILWLA